MLCTLSVCYMPECMRARGSGGLVQAPLPHKGLYIWLAMAWQDTLDLGAIDSASHPCAQDLDLILKVCPLSILMPQTLGPCHNKLIQSYRAVSDDSRG
jgi:hypothetical protein